MNLADTAHAVPTARRVAIASFAALLSVAPIHTASAQEAGFAVLAGTAVTCTDSTIIGDVGVWPGTAVTRTSCDISGTVHAGDGTAEQAYQDFLAEYARIEDMPCETYLTGTLAGVTLTNPGVYCFEAAAVLTGTLTLRGRGDWIFKIGTAAAGGALTATDFSVVLQGGAEPCDLIWWADAAVTITDSNFLGTILSGVAITITDSTAPSNTFDGDVFAHAAVTMTGADITGCEGGHGHGGNGQGCNQGVGNGPEGCDPGNSNQGDPTRSNDENGGTPGNPGRKGGNGK